MRRRLIILTAMLISTIGYSQHKYSCAGDAVAFDGYDLVSYYDGSEPVIGAMKYKYEYDGITLVFESQKNLDKFKQSPSKYLPAFGGWCATAVTGDNFVKPNYSMYKIQNNKLLFFEVKAFFNGRTHWEKNPEANELVASQRYKAKFEKQ